MGGGPLLFVGLGNPGPEYERTRHNVGFWVIDRISRATGIDAGRRGFSSLWGEGLYAGVAVILAKPLTYMNLSGRAVAALARRFGLEPRQIWLIHDDLDLEVGRLRVRRNGGAGGHRGVRSVMDALGSRDMGRIRVGIGRPPGRQDPADYVLAAPRGEELDILEMAAERAAEAALTIAREGPEAAMNRFNAAAAGSL